MISDIVKYYPNINPNEFFTVGDMLESTGDQFIFVLDEWDYIFSKDLFQENQDDFLEFLTFLLKDKPYVLLCYMTGVLRLKDIQMVAGEEIDITINEEFRAGQRTPKTKEEIYSAMMVL